MNRGSVVGLLIGIVVVIAGLRINSMLAGRGI
jgi:hypothetical protein